MFFTFFFGRTHPSLPQPNNSQMVTGYVRCWISFHIHTNKAAPQLLLNNLTFGQILLVNYLVSISFAETNQPFLFISFATRFATLWTFLRLMWPFQVVFTSSFITEIVFLYFILQFLGPRTFIDVIFVCFASLCSLVIWRRFRNEVSLWTWKPVWFIPLVHWIGTSLFVSLLGLFVSHL